MTGKLSRVRELSLFSGAGGGLLGSKLLGWETVCAVEFDHYCQRLLWARQRDGLLEPFPIYGDVREFCGLTWRGKVDVVTGGFPCQPFSVAGRQLGEDDERNLWPDTARVLGEVRPRYALLENVTGLLRSGYFGTILGDLADLGYDAEWCCLSAAEVGAPHRRNRLWILAHAEGAVRPVADSASMYSNGGNLHEGGDGKETPVVQPGNSSPESSFLADASSVHAQGLSNGQGQVEPGRGSWWESEPDVGRVAHGVASRVDRLRAIGNGQVPQCMAMAWRMLIARVA